MREFGKDAPEFFCFKLEGEETVYKIPLAASMTNKQLAELDEIGQSVSRQMEWLRQFIGDKVEDMQVSTTSEIFRAWGEESKKQGASAGES